NPFGLWIDLEAWAIPAEGRSPDAVRSDVHTALFAGHLARVFATVLRIAKISPKVLWGNAGEGVGGLATAAAESLDPAVAQPLLDVCDRVLTAKTLPGLGGPASRRRSATIRSAAGFAPAMLSTRTASAGRSESPDSGTIPMPRPACTIRIAAPTLSTVTIPWGTTVAPSNSALVSS